MNFSSLSCAKKTMTRHINAERWIWPTLPHTDCDLQYRARVLFIIAVLLFYHPTLYGKQFPSDIAINFSAITHAVIIVMFLLQPVLIHTALGTDTGIINWMKDFTAYFLAVASATMKWSSLSGNCLHMASINALWWDFKHH